MTAVRGVRSWLATGDWGQYRKHPWWAALLFGPAVAAVAALIAGAAWRTLIVPGPDGATVIPVQHASSSRPRPRPRTGPPPPGRPRPPGRPPPGSRRARPKLFLETRARHRPRRGRRVRTGRRRRARSRRLRLRRRCRRVRRRRPPGCRVRRRRPPSRRPRNRPARARARRRPGRRGSPRRPGPPRVATGLDFWNNGAKVPARPDRCGQYGCSGRSAGRDRCRALVPPGISRMNVGRDPTCDLQKLQVAPLAVPLFLEGRNGARQPRVCRPLNPGHPTLHRQDVTWITLNPTACPDSGVSGRYPL